MTNKNVRKKVTSDKLVAPARLWPGPRCLPRVEPGSRPKACRDDDWSKTRLCKFIASIFVIALVTAPFAHAVPNQIRFQGRLTDKQGVPIVGLPNVKFDIYSVASGGASLWNSGQLTVTTNDAGLFATDLGPVPTTIFSQNPDLYLQVTVVGVAGPQVLSPRQKLSSVPYAMEANHAVTAESASTIPDDSVTSSKIKVGAVQNLHLSTDSVHSLNIKNGEVNFVDLAAGAVRSSNIQDGSIQWVELSTDAVRSENIKDFSIEGIDVATDTIISAHILDGAIQAADFKDGAVTTLKIADSAVMTAKISTGAVTRDRIQNLAIDSSKVESLNVSKLAGQINDSQIQSVDISKVLNITGIITAFGGTAAPPGWLLCDGSAVSRTTYAALFNAVGTAFGAGDGSGTFNVPDFRGRFLRGRDGAAGRDPDSASRSPMTTGGNSGNNVGSVQDESFRSHAHGVTDPGHRHAIWGDIFNSTVGGGRLPSVAEAGLENWIDSENAQTGISINNSGGNETRPKNAYVNYIIKS